MRIKKIILTNYRGFKKTEIEFHECVNVIYGVNGSGKSTIINALARMFFVLGNKAVVPFQYTLMPSDDFNDPNKECSIEIEVDSDDGRKSLFLRKPKPKDSPNMDTPSVVGRPVPVTSVDLFQEKTALYDGTFLEGDCEYFKEVSGACGLLMPGTVRTTVKTVKSSENEFALEVSPEAPFAVMKGIHSFEQLRSKFEELEAVEQQKRLEGDIYYRDARLEQVRSSLKMLDRRYGEIKIDRTIKGKPFVVEKDGRFFKLVSQLSAGEAGIIAILCYVAFSEAPLAEEIFPILVDEIDNSLHPRWQTKIVSNLIKHFKNRQFIVTSHSPFVWAGLKKENIIHLQLDDEGDIFAGQPDYAKGGGIDSIITEFFDVDLYDDDSQQLINDIDELINNRRFDEAENEITKLEKDCGPLPVFVRLRTKIRFLSV